MIATTIITIINIIIIITIIIVIVVVIVITVIEITKNTNLIWRIKLKTIKTCHLPRKQMKQIRNQKKNDQTEISITIAIEKNHKPNLKDKTEN
jgi:hypothetical protein